MPLWSMSTICTCKLGLLKAISSPLYCTRKKIERTMPDSEQKMPSHGTGTFPFQTNSKYLLWVQLKNKNKKQVAHWLPSGESVFDLPSNTLLSHYCVRRLKGGGKKWCSEGALSSAGPLLKERKGEKWELGMRKAEAKRSEDQWVPDTVFLEML